MWDLLGLSRDIGTYAVGLPERVRSLVQHLVGPLTNTFTSCRSGDTDCGMDLGADAEHEFARRGLLRFPPGLLTIVQVVIDCFAKVSRQPGYCFAVESDAVRHTEHMSNKNVVGWIESDLAQITLIGHCIHHGVTPNSMNHSRTSST